MSDELVKRIQEKCAGRDRWYVMNAAEDGYCMDFDWGYDADRWMDDRLRENPDYIKRNGYHIVKKRSFTSAEELANEAAAMIEQQADQLLDARRTAEYWKAEHNAANARIAALEAQIAPVAPAVDAQPVACLICNSTGNATPCAYPTEINRQQAARIERLRKGLFEARDAMRVMSNWVKKSDPAGHSWAVRMVDRANDVLGHAPTTDATPQSEGLRKDAVPDGVEIASYRLTDDPDMTVQRVGQVTGPDLWAVRYGGNCLGKNGEWEYEPMPSSRGADFLTRCRFASAQEAIDAAIRALSQKDPQ